MGIIEKRGAWFRTGRAASARAARTPSSILRENPAVAYEIENKVRESLNIPLLPADVEAE